MIHLFVYGTLQSSFRNKFARRLAREASLLGRALMPGRLYRLRHYPCLRPARQSGEWVAGELYRLRNAAEILRVLDAYEAREYRRVLRTAVLADGLTIRSWVYLYGRALPNARRITAGTPGEAACWPPKAVPAD